MTSLFGESRGGTPTDERAPLEHAPRPMVRWLCPRLSASCFLFFIGLELKSAKAAKSLEKPGPHPLGFWQSFPDFALHVTGLA
jgi:hypothetical protein